MPLQNRVDPYGNLIRTTARGTMMGNRGGALHNESREIVRPYLGRRWIACLLEFKGRRRKVMTPRRYTELFFLDEAVAFAAGHRPCAECRRERFRAFQHAWDPGRIVLASDIDAGLHGARLDGRRRKRTWQAPIGLLPNGTFVEMEEAPYLVWDDALLLWTPDRYTTRLARPNDIEVTVLTPQPVVECFRRGYQPETHASRQVGQAPVQ